MTAPAWHAYWLPYEQDHPTHCFRPGTRFKEDGVGSTKIDFHIDKMRQVDYRFL